MQDNLLLTQYAQDNSEAAFSQIIARHLPLVYGTCRRELNSVTLAEDAAQVVFLLLARKAKTLRPGPSLAGWLYQTSVFVAKDVRKQEARRLRREEAVMQESVHEQAATRSEWDSIEPLLNTALSALKPADREAVLLRFFEGHTLAETGTLLGVAEDAARMRVNRALEKLRHYLTTHGTPVTNVALAGLLTSEAARPIPAHAASAITQGILQAISTGPSANVLLLSKGISHTMKIIKVKYAVLAAAVLLGGTSVLPFVHALSPYKDTGKALPAPLPLTGNVTTAFLLNKDQHAFYQLIVPQGSSVIVVDVQSLSKNPSSMKFNLVFQDKSPQTVAGKNNAPPNVSTEFSGFSQLRFVARVDYAAPKPLILDMHNQGEASHYWLTVLPKVPAGDVPSRAASPALAVPLFGKIIPKPITLGETKTGRLEKNAFAYFIMTLKAGRYQSLLHFSRIDAKSANIDGVLSISDETGLILLGKTSRFNPNAVEKDINQLHSSEAPDQNISKFTLKQDGVFLISLRDEDSSPVADDSSPVNFTEQIVPDDAPVPAVKKS